MEETEPLSGPELLPEPEPRPYRFFIACEGHSEALYFRSFPVTGAEVIAAPVGCSKTSLVNRTIRMLKAAPQVTYDEVWCVFDMDFEPGANRQYQDFRGAIQLAAEAGIRCAYSNDAFELWYVLHYQFIDQRQPRSFYFRKLSELWNVKYSEFGKSKRFAWSVYKKLLADKRASQARAIAGAKRLYDRQCDLPVYLQNPVTLVYQLVESLNRHLIGSAE